MRPRSTHKEPKGRIDSGGLGHFPDVVDASADGSEQKGVDRYGGRSHAIASGHAETEEGP